METVRFCRLRLRITSGRIPPGTVPVAWPAPGCDPARMPRPRSRNTGEMGVAGRRRAGSARLLLIGMCVVLMAGCGTRVDRADVVAGAGGGQVSLSARTIAQLTGRSPAPAKVAQPAEQEPIAPGPAVADQEPKTAEVPRTDRRAPAHPTPQAIHAVGRSPMPAVGALPACTGSLAPVAVGQSGTFSGVAGAITVSVRRTVRILNSSVGNAHGAADRGARTDSRTRRSHTTHPGAGLAGPGMGWGVGAGCTPQPRIGMDGSQATESSPPG